jgi:hypothetical protein
VRQRDYATRCPKCQSEIFGAIIPRVERYNGYEIETIPEDGVFGAHVRRIGGGTDVIPELHANTEDEIISLAKKFIDGIPEMKSI